MTCGAVAGALAGVALFAAPRPARLCAQASETPPQRAIAGHAAAAVSNQVAAPGAVARIAVGQTLRGELEPGDRLMADSTFADVWEFAGAAGQTVTIYVRSDEFDTYLLVLDAAGRTLGADDDSGGDLNSRLTLTLPAAGTYQIVVNSAGHERRAGLYTLSLQ